MKGLKKCLSHSYCRLPLALFMVLFFGFFILTKNTNAVDYNARTTYFGSSGWFSSCGPNQCGNWDLSGDATNSIRRFTPYFNATDGGIINVSKFQLWVDPPSGLSIQGKTGFSTEIHINIYPTQVSGWSAWQCGTPDLWKGFSLTTTNNVAVNTTVSSYSCTKTDSPAIMRLKAKILVTPAGGGTFSSTFPAFNMRWDGYRNDSTNGSIFVINNNGLPGDVQADALTFGDNVNYVNFQTFTSADSAYLEEIISTQQETNQHLIDINNNLQEQNDRDQQDRDNIEQASQDAESSADASQLSAENTGTTLLAAFTSFVNALTSASPTNCNIDMDLGNLDLGIVNLCQLSPPAGFSALASIFLILFCVPLSIATARKVISLFRSFQR